jgi:hypothetical protein
MISDQQLIIELAHGGRVVTAALLKDWRTTGLLPPLNTRGLGRAGKAFFYTDVGIVARAAFAYDVLKEFQDPRRAVWILWVAGYDVPTAQLKRIWLYRLKRKASWAVRQTEPELLHLATRATRRRVSSSPGAVERASSSILGAMLALTEPLVLRNAWIDWSIFIQQVRRVGETYFATDVKEVFDEWTIARIANLGSAVASIAESSNLIASATSEELSKARNIAAFCRLLFLQTSLPDEEPAVTGTTLPFWPPTLAAHVATPIVLAALLLVRAGRERQIQHTVREIRSLDLSRAPTAQALQRFQRRLRAIWRDLFSLG